MLVKIEDLGVVNFEVTGPLSEKGVYEVIEIGVEGVVDRIEDLGLEDILGTVSSARKVVIGS